MVVVGVVTLRELYESVDWAVIVLLASLIPVGKALDETGAAPLSPMVFWNLSPGPRRRPCWFF